MKKRLLTILHIAVWLAGTVFLITGAFATCLWFDESYSVGIINHNLLDICLISSGDVHPPLYYVLLKIFTLFFGKSLVSLRMFSILFTSLLAGVGYTHLRKDFGAKIGFWFTTLMFLFAITYRYAIEIRMYTLAPYLVTMMAIYAYRFYKSGMTDKKSKYMFLIFAILGAYTHYYALAAAGAVNFLLLMHCRKNNISDMWLKMAFIQCASYIFGFYCLVTQSAKVVGSFWISIIYPDVIYKTLSFFLVGDVPEDMVNLTEITAKVYDGLSVLFWGVCVYYFILYYKKNHDEAEPAILVLKVLGLIIGFYFAVSLIRPLYYVRYLTVLSGLMTFFLAFAFDKINKYIKPAVLVLLATVLVFRIIPLRELVYSPRNDQLDIFVNENIKDGDIIVSDNIGLISIIAVKHPDTKTYYYNPQGWDVELAYKAYSPQMKTIRDLSEVYANEGRVWVLNNYFSDSISNLVIENTNKEIVKIYDTFILPYHHLEYGFTLLE
ncbi:MAG: hypothetical protein A2Y15_01080 [Clostridiales bacterium GWF2_36_10]|nr:MAG: hypothetical protein A2Y15_01080 [Clostridiales bacterium GWF2_36_10]